MNNQNSEIQNPTTTHPAAPGGVLRKVGRAGYAVGQAWAWSIGLTSLARNTGESFSRLSALYGGLLRRRQYRRESFEDAVSRLSLTEQHLMEQAKTFRNLAFVWALAVISVCIWGFVLSQTSPRPFMPVLLCAGFIFMASTKALAWRFRFCQVRDEELYSFQQWFAGEGIYWITKILGTGAITTYFLSLVNRIGG